MTVYIVDTNVAVAANGVDTHADSMCQLGCIDKLEEVVGGAKYAVDDLGLILYEYSKRLSHAGAPGVGDKFFKFAYSHQHVASKCVRAKVDTIPDDARSFAQFPNNQDLAGFDPDDRIFVATYIAIDGNRLIINATDGGYRDYRKELVDEGVAVQELCPHMLRVPPKRNT